MSAQPEESTLSFESFIALLRVQSALRRSLHVASGGDKRLRTTAIETIATQLQSCPEYEDYLRRVVVEGVAVG